MSRARRCSLVATFIATFAIAGAWAPSAHQSLPDRLDDRTFWRMVTTFSESGGTFFSENFVSNENEWQYVIPPALPRMRRVNPKASAYIGVGPEQNFTYIAAFKPRIAFICDIRRQNMMQHLLYKALIESSSDRADFLSKLWSRRRPDGLDTSSSTAALLAGYRKEKPDSALFRLNLTAVLDRLVKRHKFALTSEDSATIRTVHGVFMSTGPDITYSSSSAPPGAPSSGTFFPLPTGTITRDSSGVRMTYRAITDSAGRVRFMRDSAGKQVVDTALTRMVTAPMFINAPPGAGYSTFAALMTEDDGAGINRGWLGSESAFRIVKDYELRNLIVPVIGDFAGSKALRAIGKYVSDNGGRVSTFYTSNVEQYLFANKVNVAFYQNVASLPVDSNSIFIRSFGYMGIPVAAPKKPNSRMGQTVSTIDTVLRAFRAGQLTTYLQLAQLQDR